MTSPGVLYIDGDERGEYADMAYPDNWTVHLAQHAGLSAALRWCLATYSDEASYGWLADDMIPRTHGWDRALEQAAGRCGMSQAQDLWVAPKLPAEVRLGEPTAGQCWGGDLLRAVGWWALPGTFQAGTDAAWSILIQRLGRMHYLDEVTVEHRHWRTGKRERDMLDTDMVDYNGHEHTAVDLRKLRRWQRSPEFRHALGRAQSLCRE